MNRAVKRSTLPPPSRLLMFVLSDRADVRTAAIPEEHTPSQSELAEETGLGIATVKRHLESLEAGGWVIREIPSEQARAFGERTRYRLAAGDAPEAPSKAQCEPRSTAHSDTSSTAQSELSSERAELRVIPELVSERSLSTAQSDPSSYNYQSNDQDDLKNSPADAVDESDGTLFPVADKAPTETAKADPAERFAEFYKTYPRHKAKARAETAWIKAVKGGAEPQVLIEAAWLFSIKTKDKDQNYLPYPATWLNDRGWEDEDDTPSSRSQNNGYQSFRNPTEPNAYEGLLG